MKLYHAAAALLAVSASAVTIAAPPSFAVRVVGHGAPMILIPGLACGGDVWNSTVDHYKDHFTCYVLTLPGFAGQPPIEAPVLPQVRDQIVAYIHDHHLKKPVIVGHSLGATLALWVAATSPDSVGKVVAVDGAPWLPALQFPNASLEIATKQADALRKTMASEGHERFVAGMRQSLQSMITSPNDVDWMLQSCESSDPKTVGEAMYELYSTDLRPEMKKIRAPVLMLAEGAYFTTPAIREAATKSYEAQIHDIPQHTLKMSKAARHFIMLDDPSFFFAEIDAFLSASRGTAR
ncbi:MAG TPA: alpha/beta hydrolase [Fimbriimonas sp.]|nr:alpha/beta hydrolase [Fimbriimonas sp.]